MSFNAESQVHEQLFINNKYVSAKSDKFGTVTNPYDNSVITDKIHFAGEEDVNDAVAAASDAFNGPWGQMSGQERARCMLALADLLDENNERLMKIESLSMGLPVAFALRFGGLLGPIWRYYAGCCDKLPGKLVPEGGELVCKMVRYEPFGVCAGIAAWNASLFFLSMKIAPAVAAGNTFVFKSSEKSPLGALQVGALIESAGFPPGVINLLSGDGSTGAMLSSHMKINRISYTGSVDSGRKVQVAAANSNLKRVTLELGGKSPMIVFEDANLDKALTHASNFFLINSGQICVAASRVLVHESIAKNFVYGLKTKFDMITRQRGNPSNTSVLIGPLADSSQKTRVMRILDHAKKDGLCLITGGNSDGNFVTPTIIMNPPVDSSVWTEEIFGPILCVKVFKTEDEAVALANNTSFGLSSSVFTGDISRALRMSKRLEAGAVSINSSHSPYLDTPLGGWKESGTGSCEGGWHGFLSYLQPKSILIDISD